MDLIKSIQNEFKSLVDQEYKDGAENFFKEPLNIYGVRVPHVRRISRESYKKVKDLSKKELFALCEQLADHGKHEEILIAFAWCYRRKKEFEPTDFPRFERWIKKYVTNWALCDDFCTHPIGLLVYEYPELLPKVFAWTKSKNRWLRRASAVSLIYPVAREKYLKEVFATADALLLDEDDLVQKGYGWMLKVASECYADDVYDYLAKHKHDMPRTAFRYALEKMPPDWKKDLMSK